MRTMFISLVLIWSLAQLASTVTKIDPVGCGTTYKCYAPKKCTADTSDAAALNKPLSQDVLTEVEDDDKITDECPALIRLHAYGTYKVYVIIESFQDTSKISSITFVQKPANLNQNSKSEFSCSLGADNVMRGSYFDKEKYVQSKPPNKLKCIFDVSRKKDVNNPDDLNFFKSANDDRIFFKIISKSGSTNLEETTKNKHFNIFFTKCDPSTIEFNDAKDNKRIYKAVEYKVGSSFLKPAGYTLGDFSCKDNYKMEFKRNNAAEFEDVKEVICEVDTFKIKGPNDADFKSYEHDESMDIRCVTEAKFFCEYNLKSKAGEQAPVRKAPDFNSNTPTTLECPTGKKNFIIVDGEEKQFMNPKFECLNYNGVQQWTFNEMKFSEEGPEVYCTHEVKCLNMIPESSVLDGDLDKNFLPTCPGGTLYVGKVDKANPGAKVTHVKCDGATGKFMYTTGDGTEHEVVDSTKFACGYPTIDNSAEVSQKNAEQLRDGSLIGIGIAVFASIVAVAVTIALSIHRTKMNKKRREAEKAADLKLWNRYCLDDDEEAKYKKAKNKEEVTAPDEASGWSAHLMSCQYRSLAIMAPNGQKFSKADDALATEDTLPFDPEDAANVPKATDYKISKAEEHTKETVVSAAYEALQMGEEYLAYTIKENVDNTRNWNKREVLENQKDENVYEVQAPAPTPGKAEEANPPA